ncbi:MAG TPA: dienelactone hydrolase family protein [Burkholderiales bacterium]
MQEQFAEVKTPDGVMPVFVARPDGKGPFPVVLMYQNVGGLSPVLMDLARRVAANGYYCALPDLYYRLGRIVIDPDNKHPHVMALRKVILDSLTDTGVMADTRAVLEHLEKDPFARKGAKGTVGFCMGGRFSVQAGAFFPDVFVANGSLFGTRMITDAEDSPHKLLDRLRGEIYFGFAEHDYALPLPQAHEFIDLLKKHCKARWEAEIHEGAHHGYSFPGREVYQERAAERSWEKIFAMFGRQLKG